jgi:hypothetical protein
MIRRRWFKPWKFEYEWVHTGYGAVVGYAWTRRTARRRLDRAIAELVSD